MKIKNLSTLLMIYLLVTSSAVFLQQYSLYSLSTKSNPTGNKVCLILIDGLRLDAVNSMPFVKKLIDSKSAIFYKSHSGLPSYSRPGYERILTGTDSLINGINSNKKVSPSLLPNIFTLAKKSGLKTSAAAFYWVKQLYPLSIDERYYYFIRDGITFKKAHEFITDSLPDFLMVHPMTVDNAGHSFGGSSVEYSKAVQSVDLEVKNLWHTLTAKGYTIIITSDHGHRDDGGHGDSGQKSTEVPLLIWNSNLPSIIPQSHPHAVTQLDIAPTICDILGLPKPIYMYGNSLVKHTDEIQRIRQFFSGSFSRNFPSFFKVSLFITYFIVYSFSLVYLGCGFMVLRAMKN